MTSLEDLLPSLQGALPASIATCSRDGTPNISYTLQVHHADPKHVALSCHILNKTRRNLEENPRATIVVLDPITLQSHRLLARFVRSVTEGFLFDGMSAQLEAMASQWGMNEKIVLLSADLFEVLSIERVSSAVVEDPVGDVEQAGQSHALRLRSVRAISQLVGRAPDLDSFFTTLLTEIDRQLGYAHTMVLLADETGGRLFTIASRGYPEEGVGSEVRFGEGVVGTVARTQKSLRIGGIGRAMHWARAANGTAAAGAAPEIPLPGLKRPQSCVAIPLLWHGELVGVLAAESEKVDAFSESDEWWLGILGNQVAPAVREMRQRDDLGEPTAAPIARPALSHGTRRFTFYRDAESIFVDGVYLTRYVPAQILWRLLRVHAGEGRADFTNRELRIDPSLHLPPVKDNLEARLLLLRKRLEQKCPEVRLQPTGRGRFRLERTCAVELLEKDTPSDPGFSPS